VEYWLKIISGIRNKRNFTARIDCLLQKLPAKLYEYCDKQATYTLKKSQTALSTARRSRYIIMSKASDFRKMILEEQAAAAALTSQEDKEHILKRLINTQERSDMYKRLHHIFKPPNTGTISHLEVPAEEWQWPYDQKQVRTWKREYEPQKGIVYTLGNAMRHPGHNHHFQPSQPQALVYSRTLSSMAYSNMN
jgi:hypothetical protein